MGLFSKKKKKVVKTIIKPVVKKAGIHPTAHMQHARAEANKE